MAFDGLEIDNNFRWTIINALSTVNAIDQAGIDAELAKRETTENREFAYGARAVAGTAEAKAWAWNEALHNDELTNMQLEAVAGGFAATPRADLAEPYAEKYFESPTGFGSTRPSTWRKRCSKACIRLCRSGEARGAGRRLARLP